ncbi:hypothetical protein TD95_002610 [Thielaviopsis punctulata]|uniref:DNA-(apurinic or apyrimidinic site) lyase n=1 Tax=Thielaviopsis punctulata TaxID=72032 RepID=A0A0F4ZKV7_9PEZI|nr:hypothetical protein TD95_002610 [Thielaviopsis punctulata]
MALRGAIAGEWNKIPLTLADLSIDTTLRCGQSFRWRKFADEWACTLRGRLVRLRQDESFLYYQAIWPEHRGLPKPHEDDTEALVRHYLSLNVDLQALYKEWASVDPHFKKLSINFAGIRILSQDAWEALVSFICSSNNNISRISQMVQKLCVQYGPFVAQAGDEVFHDFPSPHDLTGSDVESTLRGLGFGYRAKYIADTAKMVASKPSDWLDSLRNPETPSFGSTTINHNATYKNAHKELLQLKGVGPKVSDCVCLMGLAWGESVPVDTHVWQIAVRDYKFGRGKNKAFALSMYEPVGDLFRNLWGKKAGWAHSVLFTADLRSFSEQKTTGPSKPSLPLVEDGVKIKKEENSATLQSEYQSRKRKVTPPVALDGRLPKREKREHHIKRELQDHPIKLEELGNVLKLEMDVMDSVDAMDVDMTVEPRRSNRLRGVKTE